MILTGQEINKRYGGDINIIPYNINNLNPNSYNLTLDNTLMVYEAQEIDMKKDNPTREMVIPEEGFLLKPGVLYLAKTKEYTETFNLVPMLEGRSSLGRLGISVHVTAGFGDIGFCGYWTLEITVVEPVRIYPDIKICQIVYHTIEGDIVEYDGKYQRNKEVQSSMLYKELK